ncbi:hypothetical protein C4579_00690 [Candidatus Microgenomates bacterium]|nr:MAG: hypothetical protein C4579_00690 [Candidatus Microgenomates bacterium]
MDSRLRGNDNIVINNMKFVYPNLTFPTRNNRPFFYANFVATLDGKVQVLQNTQKYWPLGSETDYATLVDLRTYADALVHGKTTALAHPTIESINKPEFKQARKKRGKPETLPYMIVSNHPGKELVKKYRNAPQKPVVVTGNTSSWSGIDHDRIFSKKDAITTPPRRIRSSMTKELQNVADVIPCGEKSVDLNKLSLWLFTQGYKHVLIEGGPHLFGAFLKENLIDELFLTIAPKIIGNEAGKTLTLVEGKLFNPNSVKKWQLISVKNFGNEIFLRYHIHQ